MLKLVSFEIKKIWSHKYLIPVLIVCLVLLLFPILKMYSNNKTFIDSEREFYARYAGPLTEKNHMEIAKIVDSDDIYTYDGDGNIAAVDVTFIVADYALDDIAYMINYKNIQENIVQKANENAVFYDGRGYRYLERLNKQIAKKYSSYSQPWLISSNDWEFALKDFNYTIPAVLLIMILTAGIFTREKESKMDGIIRSSRSGTKKVFAGKIIAAGISSFGVMVAFSIVKYAAYACTTCLRGWNAPLKSIPEFAYSSLNIKIWQAVLLFAFLASVAGMMFGVLFALISSFCKKSLWSLVLSLIVLIASYLDYYFICGYGDLLFNIDINSAEVSSFLIRLRGYSFPMLLDVCRYFDNYYTISVFSYPVPSVISSLALGFVIIALITAAAFVHYTGVPRKKR